MKLKYFAPLLFVIFTACASQSMWIVQERPNGGVVGYRYSDGNKAAADLDVVARSRCGGGYTMVSNTLRNKLTPTTRISSSYDKYGRSDGFSFVDAMKSEDYWEYDFECNASSEPTVYSDP